MKAATFGILRFVLLLALITGWFVTAPAKSYALLLRATGNTG